MKEKRNGRGKEGLDEEWEGKRNEERKGEWMSGEDRVEEKRNWGGKKVLNK